MIGLSDAKIFNQSSRSSTDKKITNRATMADVEEGSGLISNDIFPSAMKNFLVMSTTFGVVHGSITVAIAYGEHSCLNPHAIKSNLFLLFNTVLIIATSVFSLSLGSYSSGFLYSTYTLTSLLCAAPFVERFGARDMMLISFIFYFLYLVFFVIGSQVDDVTTRWFFVITGAIFGGIASGIGWVSQGVYFATSAEYYTKEKGMTKHEANSMFASYFASICKCQPMSTGVFINTTKHHRYIDIGFQSLLYLLSSLLLEFTSFSEEDLFIVYSILTFLCLILVSLYLVQLPSKPDEASSMDHIKAVVMMTFTDVRAITIAPMAITFGFISVFTASVGPFYMRNHYATPYNTFFNLFDSILTTK